MCIHTCFFILIYRYETSYETYVSVEMLTVNLIVVPLKVTSPNFTIVGFFSVSVDCNSFNLFAYLCDFSLYLFFSKTFVNLDDIVD